MKEFIAKIADIHRQSALALDYQKTLLLLAALKSGEVEIESILLTPDGWRLVEPEAAVAPAATGPRLAAEPDAGPKEPDGNLT